jgi:hypothetical protein
MRVRPPAFVLGSFPCDSQAETVQCDTLNTSAASFVVNKSRICIFHSSVGSKISLHSKLLDVTIGCNLIHVNASLHITRENVKNALFPPVPPKARIMASMPVKIQYYGSDELANVTRNLIDDERIAVKQTFPHGISRAFDGVIEVQPGHRLADAYAIREAFLNIETSEDEISFFERCGPFRADVREIAFGDLYALRLHFRDWMIRGYNRFPFLPVPGLSNTENNRIGGVLSWDIYPKIVNDNPRRVSVQAWVYCDSAVEAIAATIALDLIEGANFKSCLWCTRVFEVTKDNGRQYCTMACAHRAGQKRRRAEAKILKDRGKPKNIKTKSRKGKV